MTVYTSANDSLINMENVKEIERLKFSSDIQQLEDELELQTIKIDVLEKDKQNSRLINTIYYFIQSFGDYLYCFFIFQTKENQPNSTKCYEIGKSIYGD